MTQIANKIEAKDYTIRAILDSQKYVIDFFQREYRWQRKHIEQLIADLESAFFNCYVEGHKRSDVASYNCYYLGPIVLSNKNSKRSIIDGQQRLSSITLLLIYLHNLQRTAEKQVGIEGLIYSEKYDEKSFNLDIPERQACLTALFENGDYQVRDSDSESTKNLYERYLDIETTFPDELKNDILPFFIDWFIDNVVLVLITAYSDDNAYTIFETMNDRGLNLTATEMLKGFILSKAATDVQRAEINKIWKSEIQRLHEYSDEEDLKFFQTFLRARHAVTIRPGKAGSANEDFEKVGTRFHTWVKDNLNKLSLSAPSDFYTFVEKHIPFYASVYRKAFDATLEIKKDLEHLRYCGCWGFASSLADPLLLAPIKLDDGLDVINLKLNMVARYVETFAVYRAVNYRNFSQSSIRYTMYNLVLEIRNKDVSELGSILKKKLAALNENLTGITDLRMHGQNRRFVKFFLCRLTAHIENRIGLPTNFDMYFNNQKGKPYEIEHIWADDMSKHSAEFTQTEEFKKQRNMVGGLLLLPNGTNQSFNSDDYTAKREYYQRENLLAQSLHENSYKKHPNFRTYKEESGILFKAHTQFKTSDMKARQMVYQQIAEEIWSLDFFDNE